MNERNRLPIGLITLISHHNLTDGVMEGDKQIEKKVRREQLEKVLKKKKKKKKKGKSGISMDS